MIFNWLFSDTRNTSPQNHRFWAMRMPYSTSAISQLCQSDLPKHRSITLTMKDGGVNMSYHNGYDDYDSSINRLTTNTLICDDVKFVIVYNRNYKIDTIDVYIEPVHVGIIKFYGGAGSTQIESVCWHLNNDKLDTKIAETAVILMDTIVNEDVNSDIWSYSCSLNYAKQASSNRKKLLAEICNEADDSNP